MSWEAGVMVLLAAALIGGMVWYERARPPSQVVALIAALAALAVVGRIAFSPVPNVVPTTDIALLSGYTLGGAPGFAVGALAALVSNFWLGQGPWTPWQMAGWGMAGVLGGLLARASGRRLGRVGLAVACGAAGFAYGALLDFSLMITYGGEQSLDRFLALSARGLPFNIAHAAGNAALALIAGPALVRILLRYRRRFEFAWARPAAPARTAATTAALLLTLVLLVPAQALAAKGPAGAVAYLRAAQNADGGFGAAPGQPSSPAMTGWAALGLESAGVHPGAVRSGGPSALAYLRANAGQIATAGDLQRTILVLAAAGRDPRRFGGRDLVARLLAQRDGNGSWDGQVNPTAFGILALEAAGQSGNSRSAEWLAQARSADGGWGFVPDAGAGDPDSTGAALQALAATGGSRNAIDSGVRYLRDSQRSEGGWMLAGGGTVNAQSTAWAVQGLVGAGASAGRGIRYLAGLQAGDGHYRYSQGSDQTPVWVTAQALQAVERQAFPLRRVSASSAGKGGVSAAPQAGPAAVKHPGAAGAAPPAAAAPGSPQAPAAVAGSGLGESLQRVEASPTAAKLSGEDDSVPSAVGAGWVALALAAGGALLYGRRRPA
jgi:hypothetical protein